jgi:hypothetical protein
MHVAARLSPAGRQHNRPVRAVRDNHILC